ncbi:hypothetical protein V5735_18755 (plasmid) [Haladaptatus sp. SPP-AMP-3]|uniref:hypothetical protein n=1 Tax=Haladaptatus sp. SPP-AMP-3 TaxID=3121295 RepID=UPI003C2DB7D1
MVSKRPSRRTILVSGGTLIGLGIAGSSIWSFDSDDDQIGPGGLTIGTVPKGSDPLIWVDTDAVKTAAQKATVSTLLDASTFDDLPDVFVEGFDEKSQSGIDTNDIAELVLVGSDTPTDGGAIVWADWSKGDIVDLLGTDQQIKSGSYGDHPIHTVGKKSVSLLTDTSFALGTTTVVKSIVDARNGDVGPVGGDTLDKFEGTDHGAVRFSFNQLPLSCKIRPGQRSAAYDKVTQVVGATPASDVAIRLRLFAASRSAADKVATAIRDDLGIPGSNDDAGNLDREYPNEVTNDITVRHESDFVTIEYGGVADDTGKHVRNIVKTVSCLTLSPEK